MREAYGLFVAVTAGMSGVVKWQFPAIPVILLALFLLGSQAAFASDNQTSLFNGSENFTTGNPIAVEIVPVENNSTAPLAQNETSSDEPSTEPSTENETATNITIPVDDTPTQPNETTTNSTEDVSTVDNGTESNETFEIPDTGFTIPNSTESTENQTDNNTAENDTVPVNFTVPNPVVVEIPENETVSNETETNETVLDETETSIDTVPPTFSSFGVTNETPAVGSLVEFHTLWKDNFGLDEWVFSWNESGNWTNFTNSFISSYDDQTQIRVLGGWKYMKDLTFEDKIATLNGERVEWDKPIRLLKLPHDGIVFKINGDINSVVTSDHKVYARVDNDASFAVRKITDPLVGLSIDSFEFIRIDDAYKMSKNGYHLTFLGESLQPVYVSNIKKELYTGMIYDITVPNHIILVKRDGVPVWSSNLNVEEAWSIERKIVGEPRTIGYEFFAHDLFNNWNRTGVKTIEVQGGSPIVPPETLDPNYTENITITDVEIIQGQAMIDVPVTWTKKIKVENKHVEDVDDVQLEIEVPEYAENIVVKEKIDGSFDGFFGVQSSEEILATDKKWIQSKIPANKSVDI